MSVRRSRRKSLLSGDVREFDCDDFTSEDDIASTSARTCGKPSLKVTEKDDFSVVGVRMLEPENPIPCHQLSFNRTWTAEEDERLLSWVQCNGAARWTFAAQQFSFRTPRECRDRWKMHLNPEQKKKILWTDEEDLLLNQLHQVYGSQWAEYAKHLPGRTDQDIRNRWNLILQPQKLFYNRPVTPSLSSDSFYQRIEPVKLFGTPKTPPKSCVKEEFPGSVYPSTRNFESETPKEAGTPTDAGTPLSLDICSLLSPEDHLLLSPTNLWTPEGTIGTPETAAFLSELEALLLQSSETDVSISKDLRSHHLDTPPNVKRFTGLRSKCLDDRCDGSASNTDESVLTRLTNRRTMACQLKFDTPCILRKRKRRSPQATRRNDVRFGSCEYKDSSCLLTASELSPRSEAPFTPSRFLNSPQVVTSTPVAKPGRLTPPEPLYTSLFCSPPAKRLLVNEFAQTPTPFKPREHSFIDVLMPEDVEDVDVSEGIDFLPFSSYSSLDDLSDRDPVMKTEAVNRDIAGRQLTLTKSLDKPWSSSGTGNHFVESLISLETPSKSLINDESLMFSPPSIIRDTLHESLTFDQSTPSRRVGHLLKAIEPSISQTKVGWERVACGQTLTQMELVKQAKELLDDNKLYIRPRSLQL